MSIAANTRNPSKELHGKISAQMTRSSWTRYHVDKDDPKLSRSGQTGRRNAPSLVMNGFSQHLFWDGRNTAFKQLLLGRRQRMSDDQFHNLGMSRPRPSEQQKNDPLFPKTRDRLKPLGLNLD